MAFNQQLDQRIRKILAKWRHTEAKKMFGGVCHLVKGHMVCGVYKDYLILRLGETQAAKALETAFTRPFDITGRPMKGWVMISHEGFNTDVKLATWLRQAKEFVRTLPPK
jgi:TfoX/Sxy family transcriptional regulator of competence genes